MQTYCNEHFIDIEKQADVMNLDIRNKVFLCICEDYWQHAAVAIFSVVKYVESLEIFLFYEKDNVRWRRKIEALVKEANCNITFIAFDIKLVDGLKDCSYLGPAAYYRLFVPELINVKDDQILYLDSDVLVRGSVRTLLGTALNGNVVAARPVYWTDQWKKLCVSLKRSEDIPYFNSGVMVIDLLKWRQENITEKTISFIREHPDRIRFADQCALNYVVGPSFKFLSPEWNVTMAYWQTKPTSDLDFAEYEDIVAAKNNPLLVHYNGPSKPWHLSNTHPWKNAYISIRRRLQKTPYLSDDFGSACLSRVKKIFREPPQ